MSAIGEKTGPNPARLAQLIRGLRERHEWSQSALAASAGLSERTIQRVENAKGSNRQTRRSLAGAFGFKDRDVFEKPRQIPSVEKTPIPKRETLFPEIEFRDFIQTTSRSESKSFLARMSTIIDDTMVKLEKNSEFIQITPIRDGRALRTMLEQSLGHKTEEFGYHTPAARKAFAKLDNYLDSYYKIAIAKFTPRSVSAKLRSIRAALDLPPAEKLEAIPEVDEHTRAKVANYLAKIDYYKNNPLNIAHEYSATERIRIDADLDALLARISQQQCVIGAGLTCFEPENVRIQLVHIVLAPEAAFPAKIRVSRFPRTQEDLEKLRSQFADQPKSERT